MHDKQYKGGEMNSVHILTTVVPTNLRAASRGYVIGIGVHVRIYKLEKWFPYTTL